MLAPTSREEIGPEQILIKATDFYTGLRCKIYSLHRQSLYENSTPPLMSMEAPVI